MLSVELMQMMRVLVFLWLSVVRASGENVGAVLGSAEAIVHFLHQVEVAGPWLGPGRELVAHTVSASPSPLKTAVSVCELISRQVSLVIASDQFQDGPPAVSFTCGFYGIPVIGISNRDSALSDKNLHGSFLRTVPPWSQQADVWRALLEKLGYTRVVLIHSADPDGRAAARRLLRRPGLRVDHLLEYERPLDMELLSQQLNKTRQQSIVRVVVLYASAEDAPALFRIAKSLEMINDGWVWIVSEQAMRAKDVPEGALGVELADTREDNHIRDSVRVAALALRALAMTGNHSAPPNECVSHGRWAAGDLLLQLLKNQTLLDGATGHVAFDEQGDRLDSEYQVLNIKGGLPRPVGKWEFDRSLGHMAMELRSHDIIWPGGRRSQPPGYHVNRQLRVVTLEERPFVWVSEPQPGGGCAKNEEPCPLPSPRGVQEMGCCRGYCVDLLHELATALNFSYQLYRAPDGQYGSYDFDSKGQRVWSGLVGELVEGRADMVVAPLSINPARARAIDFSKPFKFQGIAMIQKRKPRQKKMESFLQPFRKELWVLVFVSVFVVAAVLWLLDKLSPFDSHLADEKALNLSSAVWFSFGVLLNSGIGDKTPASFSARVLAMVWAGFSMIVVASYTANLAAWLVLDNTEAEISGLEDPRLRNPVEGFRYGTVRSSYVDMYFGGQVELSNMYRLMEEHNVRRAEDGVEAVRQGRLNLFFWDSPRLEFEAAHDCDLVLSGDTFARSGYGLGLQKGSFWSDLVTLQVLNMHENGFMEGLDTKWILGGTGEERCQAQRLDQQQVNTLGMETMADVFMLVGSGMVAGLVLIVFEVIIKRAKMRRARRLARVRRFALRWRLRAQELAQVRANCIPEHIPPPPPPPQGQPVPVMPRLAYPNRTPRRR